MLSSRGNHDTSSTERLLSPSPDRKAANDTPSQKARLAGPSLAAPSQSSTPPRPSTPHITRGATPGGSAAFPPTQSFRGSPMERPSQLAAKRERAPSPTEETWLLDSRETSANFDSGEESGSEPDGESDGEPAAEADFKANNKPDTKPKNKSATKPKGKAHREHENDDEEPASDDQAFIKEYEKRIGRLTSQGALTRGRIRILRGSLTVLRTVYGTAKQTPGPRAESRKETVAPAGKEETAGPARKRRAKQ